VGGRSPNTIEQPEPRGVSWTRCTAFVAGRRPDLRAPDRDLLAWACLDVANSIFFQRIELPGPEYADLLAGIIDRVVDTDLDTDHAAVAP
jgi:hypothetical protein